MPFNAENASSVDTFFAPKVQNSTRVPSLSPPSAAKTRQLVPRQPISCGAVRASTRTTPSRRSSACAPSTSTSAARRMCLLIRSATRSASASTTSRRETPACTEFSLSAASPRSWSTTRPLAFSSALASLPTRPLLPPCSTRLDASLPEASRAFANLRQM